MLTGCRLNEIQTLPWEVVDLDSAKLRLRDSKMGARMVPLSRTAVSVLSALPRPAVPLPGAEVDLDHIRIEPPRDRVQPFYRNQIWARSC